MPNCLFCQAKLRTADISQLSCCSCFSSVFTVFCFFAGEDKTVALECKKALAAAHSDIAHETAFFPAPNRAAHKNCFALLTYQIRQCKHHQNNQNNCHFFSLIKPVVMQTSLSWLLQEIRRCKLFGESVQIFYLSVRTISLQHSAIAL